MKPIAWITCLLLTGVWSIAEGGGDATAGKTLYATCAACHGQQAEGNPALKSPALAGQAGWYLARQITHFQTGIRGSDPQDTYGLQMRPMAMTLATDQAIADVVAYITTLPPTHASPTLDGDPNQGQPLYQLCVTCHGRSAEGNPAYQAPRLAQQYDWYLLTQLQHFQAGIRGKPPKDTYGIQMQAVAMTLGDEQAMKHVIAYIKSLDQKLRP